MNLNIIGLIKYFMLLTVSFHDTAALFGFFIIITIFSQIFSGIMLSFSLVPEAMLVPLVRDEEDLEDLYIDDFFWIHERGVDLLFIFSWAHLFRKLYINSYEYEHEIAWKSGVFTFIVLQIVTFFGLVLCCTHLSEITLTIAANIMHTFFFFHGKVYWWIFTDKNLNTDTLIRLTYGHYVSAFYLAYLGILHGIDMHYDWKNEAIYDGLESEMSWWDEALLNELGAYIDFLIFLNNFCWWIYPEPEALSYEIFMWGDIGLISDVRFYGVAPHWYFRPYMAWLIVCPHHKTGIFGLIFLFFILFHQATIHAFNENNYMMKKKLLLIRKEGIKQINFYKQYYYNIEFNLIYQLSFYFFFMCLLYTNTFLPYGRFYNRLGGNNGMLFAYFYVFFYLANTNCRRPNFINLQYYFVYNKINFLKKIN